METILIGLTLTAIIVPALLLAVLVAGIRREEQAASLTGEPPGLSAAVARRLLGVYTRMPARADRCEHRDCEVSTTPDGRA